MNNIEYMYAVGHEKHGAFVTLNIDNINKEPTPKVATGYEIKRNGGLLSGMITYDPKHEGHIEDTYPIIAKMFVEQRINHDNTLAVSGKIDYKNDVYEFGVGLNVVF